MNMTKKAVFRLVLGVVSLLSADLSAQQTFQFSQYMFNGLIINPAYAGADNGPSLTFCSRSQWKGIDGAPVTQTLSAHTLFARQHVGAGINIINDKIGVHNNQIVSLAASYHLKFSSQTILSFGMQGGYSHRESDYHSLGTIHVQDPKIANGSVAQNMIDFGAGFYLRTRLFDAGISVPYLLPGKLRLNDTVAVSLTKRQGLLFSRVRLEASPSVTIEPGFLIKYFPGLPVSFDANVNTVIHKVLIVGVSYRKSESVDLLLRAQVTRQLQLGYGYDHMVGKVSRLTYPSHELIVNYRIKPLRSGASSPR